MKVTKTGKSADQGWVSKKHNKYKYLRAIFNERKEYTKKIRSRSGQAKEILNKI